ncbi:MAG TPA: DNA starvation/stationary phase protection protein [bacterium]|nr:DNA starvation/stationary phase protection protein [bacterium]
MQESTTIDTVSVRTTLEHAFMATYALYFKTHSYHWNVTAPDFASVHKMLEEQYDDLWEAIDAIAERFRVFGLGAPSMVPSISALPVGTTKQDMFRDLLADHERVIAGMRAWISVLEEANDAAGADFLVARLAEHEKMAWMLRASIA